MRIDLWFTLLYSVFLIVALTTRFLRIKKTRELPKQKGTVYRKHLFKVMFVLYLLIVICTVTEYFVVFREVNYFVSLLGFIMYLGIIPVRNWAINALGKFMSEDIEIRPDHKLNREGPYKYARHPLLACLVLELTGFVLIPNSYYSLLPVFIIYVPLVVLRKNLEEKFLVKKFGDEYLAYKRDVWAFLPVRKLS